MLRVVGRRDFGVGIDVGDGGVELAFALGVRQRLCAASSGRAGGVVEEDGFDSRDLFRSPVQALEGVHVGVVGAGLVVQSGPG